VPVTVITAEMIRMSGARNLQDALDTFVPGMTFVVDHNEMNVAMRGVYASSQQKILVLLNGHRLNSHAYSSANPDFSISLDKLKQIEVLRGPASSLYGNVALTAVINLVTLDGKDLNGALVRGGLGNYGQKTASAVAGLGLGDNGDKGDVLLWGSIYRSTGEAIPVSAAQDFSATPISGYALTGAVENPSSYDLGLNLRYGGFSVLASHRYGKWTSPFSDAGTTGEVYNPAAYQLYQGQGPGLGQYYNHLELKYALAVSESFELEATLYYDTNTVGGMAITSPATGGAIFLHWDDDATGGTVQGRYRYQLGSVGSGSLMMGVQVEGMRLIDSQEGVASHGVWTSVGDMPSKPLLQPGHEETYSAFTQLKHQLPGGVVLNGGLRFDFKERHLGPPIHDLSPRVALIWKQSEHFDAKLSYSQSFVDAPYWYRYNSLPSYQGSQNLLPEHLQSLQFTPSVTFLGGKLKNTTNVFYDHLYDAIFRNNAALPGQPYYQNAGLLDTLGVEEEFSWLEKAYRIRANATYQHLLRASDYPNNPGSDEISNVPAFVGNLVVDGNPLFFWSDNVWLNLTAHYNSSQASPISIRFTDASGNVIRDYEEPNNRVPAYVLFNLGLHLTAVGLQGLVVDATIYNVFDQKYEQGGSPLHPYPQPGRWYLINVGYHFDVADL
jgi:iron complex outermembrane receptor protein